MYTKHFFIHSAEIRIRGHQAIDFFCYCPSVYSVAFWERRSSARGVGKWRLRHTLRPCVFDRILLVEAMVSFFFPPFIGNGIALKMGLFFGN